MLRCSLHRTHTPDRGPRPYPELSLKKRADVLLVAQGLCDSRSLAQRLILAGEVRIGQDHVVRKPGQLFPEETTLRVTKPFPYVSRGALKLLAGIEAFSPPLSGRVALDLGASTGGFSDVMLQNDVSRVYAVDVGYGQLHAKIRNDPRVVCLERVNARYLTAEQIPENIDILTADVSFISLRKVLPAAAVLLAPDAWILVLVKPQFEAGRHEVGKGGVIRDPAVRQRCVEEICTFARESLGWFHHGTVASPVKGPKGNQEFIVAFTALRPPEGEEATR
ncbi:MAG: TlyA family RNA methyltransferase [Lentisphaerae bacterium]|jgi:23S rRNA (cytidine1920-2'-O)/16S rRNA (cytidine1409-2'-O)-methyltransferase|nr:TlyA family RNA methyltransferase [Lentisphaerota bacterium]MBT4820610.1 TlyA family RNA methyltransferase [Lentisphaerota bacterium]MBT5605380.1 TlyA family RNA methyltransferase [Lentisphaerota bacterium]MBT7060385.1 TlyA family RNA methyltransferase [Lentisphaerota bacterium]MBT7844761.1 TlyA family RNA methyltransferase [Lentisphaerota bacterium]